MCVQEINTKVCIRCKIELPATLEFFRSNNNTKDNLSPWCKKCFNEYNREYRVKHKQYFKDYRQQWLKSNPDYYKEYTPSGKRSKEHSRKYRQKYKHSIAIYRKEWKKQNKGYYKRWREENKDKISAYNQTRRSRKLNAEGYFTSEDVVRIREEQKNCCYYCGNDINENYHIDHYIPLSRGGTNYPDNIVISCPSCNFRKRDSLPHEYFSRFFAEL